MTSAEGTSISLASEPPRPDALAAYRLASVELPGTRWLGEGVGEVTGISLDSRSVHPGDLYCALPGARVHGASFVSQAARRGAVAVLTDDEGLAIMEAENAGVLPVLLSDDPRAVMADLASAIYAHPTRELTMLGVTGTNGKTSVTTMLTRVLRGLGYSTGMVGTSGTEFTDTRHQLHRVGTVRTTPESTDLHGIFARMREHGTTSVAMEVSSHAMVLHRADAILFDAVGFTNLSQDHLDFHADMDEYFEAKASLFTPEHARRGVICIDDEWGRRLAKEASIPVVTYAATPGAGADYQVLATVAREDGSEVTISRPGRADLSLYVPVLGRHYVANAVAVIALLEQAGYDGDRAASVLRTEGTVPGRMEIVATTPRRGIVDYSHTEDALAQALTTLAETTPPGKLIVVMGAGGDRDSTKRPLMGAAAARYADLVVVTDDNPRSEDPAAIREAVMAGISDADRHRVLNIAGRAEAIRRAVALSEPGDTILVAGKGAETGQDIGGVIHPFDDRDHLRAALAAADRQSSQKGQPC